MIQQAMSAITVEKAQLLTKLMENREKHQQAYREALEGYLIQQREELEAKLLDLSGGRVIGQYLKHTPPEDHTKDYDEAIDMLQWATGDEVDLNHGQFRAFVRDDWGWKQDWQASNSSYRLSAAAARAEGPCHTW